MFRWSTRERSDSPGAPGRASPSPDDFELAAVEVGDPGDGELVVRNVVMSVDPYMRGRMNDAKSYVPPFELGRPLQGGAVGEVVASRADGFAEGDLVLHQKGWRELAVLSGDQAERVSLPDGVPPSALLGALGMPGMTAWVGVTEIAPVAAGETVFVSAAAGAVGSVAGQLAQGARVHGDRERGRAGEGRLRARRAGLRRGVRLPRHRRRARRCASWRPTASTSTSTTSAASSSRPRSAPCACAGGSPCAASVSAYNATEPPPGPRNLALLVGKRGRDARLHRPATTPTGRPSSARRSASCSPPAG